jgi:16S rRNA (guanine966-N2)-methyltransferase
MERARVVEADVLLLARRGTVPGSPFSLLLLDPPYRLAWCDIEGLTSELARSGLLVDEAVVVYEHSSRSPVDWPQGFALWARKKYGSTGIDIVVYERGAEVS